MATSGRGGIEPCEHGETGRCSGDAAIPDADVLATVRADLYRFDVTLREEPPGTWRVTSAGWRPAALDDFR